MPSALKLAFSLSVLLVALGVYRFEQSLANESLARVAALHDSQAGTAQAG